MDFQTLSNLFGTTLNPDPNIRKAAELQIRKIGNEEGMIAALLQIIAADSIDIATRQACSVWLKNRVYTCYTLEAANPRRLDLSPIKDTDRDALRHSLLPLLANSPSRSISVQLSHTLKNVIAFDLPNKKWPTLPDEIKQLLASSDVGQVHAGCLAALESIRAFRFRQRNDILPTLVASLFPTLVEIANKLLTAPPSTAQEAPTMLHLILKTYKTSIGVHLSPHQQSPESIVPWGQLLFKVVNLRIPNEVVPQDEDERERCEWWKAKKWAYNTLGRLFHRFGNPSQLPSTMQDEYNQFAQHFSTVFAPEILTIYLQQVELYVQGQTWLSKKCQYQIFQFFTECVKPKSTWAQLKPHFETLVSSFVFPQLTFNAQRQHLWENDPVDYVRIAVDEYESFSTPVSAATSFLFALASNRTKVTFMPILGFINQVLRSNAPPVQKFGALNMTAALGPWIMRHPEVKNNMEQFMLQFVTPELNAKDPYIRAIALEILGTVTKAGLVWSGKEKLEVHFRAVAASLDDPELPVRVQAALALTEMILVHEDVKTAVSPQVGKVIQDLLKLSDETDLDILNRSMEVMVDQFQTELLPVAAQLTARLCESYMRLARETVSQEEALNTADNIDIEESLGDIDDDKTFAAMGIAKTISTVVASIETAPEILAQVQEVIIPIITFTLDHKLLELLDNMYDLIDSLTYKSRAISPSMWPVFESTYKLFKSEAIDFLDEMLPSLDNFVSFGSEVIKSRADYKQMLLDIYSTSISNEQLGENDRINGSKLAESMLLNLRGSLDDALQGIINIALGVLDTAQGTALKLTNLEVLINTVLYNPVAALHFMETYRPNMARVFFDKWFAAINSAENKLPRVHDKKLTIVALCALLELSPEGIPVSLRDGWPGIIAGIIQTFKDLPKAIEARKALEQALQEEVDSDDEADDKFLNLEDTEDDVWDQDSAYLEMLAREGARLRQQSEKPDSAEDDEDEDDDTDDEDIDEELGYISPLDNVDPYVTFKQALGAFEAQNPQMYQLATTSLNIEQQTQLMEVIRQAEQNATTPQA
ncbi:ARM repeat-containing protein [Macrolepiota fuliginosa MF-IS2]|uniref:ARM repeat-containing protein n=1 Tax=Macrolepiota fuliginosa MF-IS2 TaxID=1400762 RepID=A0A9P5XLF0_9AGAR|nr:ARM repeat-containing protein [Macrolepiota fuliginosa MF-IS2]